MAFSQKEVLDSLSSQRHFLCLNSEKAVAEFPAKSVMKHFPRVNLQELQGRI